MINKAEKKLRNKLIRALLQTGNSITKELDKLVWDVAGILKNEYRNTSSLNVWDLNGRVKQKITSLLHNYSANVTAITEWQIKSVFEAVEQKNDEIFKSKLIQAAGVSVAVGKLYKYLNRTLPSGADPNEKIVISEKVLDEVAKSPRNPDALNAFLNRKIDGLKLSEHVWRLSDETVFPLIESALSEGIETGKSAYQISRDIRQYLNNPDALYRRVRDSKGKLRLSTAAKNFKPGRGVYRSAYKNALRLTQEQINQSYRAFDFQRWQNIDFIIGITVELSEQHPVIDICDMLQGDYPTGFYFTGFHVKCFCHATPKLIPKDDFKRYLKGEKVKVIQIENTPKQFNTWVSDNKKRIEGWKSKPYFLEYNKQFIK